MLDLASFRGRDVFHARLLLGLECDNLARLAGVSERTLRSVEAGDKVTPATINAVLAALWAQGVRIDGPGLVRHVDGRLAPTHEAVGKVHGYRLRRAAWALAWSPEKLASEARISVRLVRRMYAGRDLNASPSAGLYRVFCALQLAGFVFGLRSARGRGDRCTVPRPGPEARDWSIARLGSDLHHLGMLPEEDETAAERDLSPDAARRMFPPG